MTSAPYFLCSDAALFKLNMGESVTAPAEIQSHLKAQRIKSGEIVNFMSGKGHLLQARCADERTFRFSVLAIEVQDAPTPCIELCVAPPLGDALWETLGGAVQLGVSGVHFVASEHCQLSSRSKDPPWERALRVVKAACEQSGLARTPEVSNSWNSLDALLESSDFEFVFADEALATRGGVVGIVGGNFIPYGRLIRLFIGPEGGWSAGERQKLGARSLSLGLGPLVMRVPTATIAAMQSLKLLCATT